MTEYKIIFNPAVEQNMADFEWEFTEFEYAKAALDIVANYTLFLHETSLMPDYSNFGLVVQLVDGKWEEIDDEGCLI